MRLTSLHAEGLRAGDSVELVGPDTLARLPDGPAGIAILDALDMVAATCEPTRTKACLVALGIAPDEAAIEQLDEDGLPIQVHIEGGDAGALIDAGRSRTARVKASFELDPPLFGQLRQHAVRDPRLVPALSEATLSLTVGWMWTTDETTASIGLLSVAVGGMAFPSTGSERPGWLPELLHVVGQRIRRVPALGEVDLAARLHEASLSPDPEVRARLANASIDPMPMTPPELDEAMRREHVRLGKLIRQLGITADGV